MVRKTRSRSSLQENMPVVDEPFQFFIEYFLSTRNEWVSAVDATEAIKNLGLHPMPLGEKSFRAAMTEWESRRLVAGLPKPFELRCLTGVRPNSSGGVARNKVELRCSPETAEGRMGMFHPEDYIEPPPAPAGGPAPKKSARKSISAAASTSTAASKTAAASSSASTSTSKTPPASTSKTRAAPRPRSPSKSVGATPAVGLSKVASPETAAAVTENADVEMPDRDSFAVEYAAAIGAGNAMGSDPEPFVDSSSPESNGARSPTGEPRQQPVVVSAKRSRDVDHVGAAGPSTSTATNTTAAPLSAPAVTAAPAPTSVSAVTPGLALALMTPSPAADDADRQRPAKRPRGEQSIATDTAAVGSSASAGAATTSAASSSLQQADPESSVLAAVAEPDAHVDHHVHGSTAHTAADADTHAQPHPRSSPSRSSTRNKKSAEKGIQPPLVPPVRSSSCRPPRSDTSRHARGVGRRDGNAAILARERHAYGR
ncbi:hypothetical protein BDK51DRAFT_45227 [Blyttiomyces helicus]|uniref:Uncharacterized protein n=1 Tax=Blyttiomyces helicus TaxID=388810 RepID=A0A4P9WMC3_9FUNG|nr:hypothetical protein BDK51DRAFT_45227 [Blyttiomyces helicus]|eukprot:RKO91866.1 hypothetical protein BDK51DRAFT_45227 [Blyttiomyces helicus]